MDRTNLQAALQSGKGKVRHNNEDAFYFNGKYASINTMDEEASLFADSKEHRGLFAICDGMGGYDNGEVAAYTAVSNLPKLQQALLSEKFGVAITKWVTETNNIILHSVRGGGCTLALLYYSFGTIYIAHIGDSRVYRYHEGNLYRETKDHSKLQVLLDAGIITEKEAEAYPQKHVITRALGMNEDENGRCLPSIRDSLKAVNGDTYILCSDGITDMLTDNQISCILQQNDSVKNCAKAIFQAAMDSGGKDNATVIVVKVKEEDNDSKDHLEIDPYESTVAPERQSPAVIRVEQVITIEQSKEQTIIIKSQISNCISPNK